ncbi:MAG: hypothetical protein PUB60_08770 [Veillonellaceae bacterium]|nr:hypothetical protein [Veillonellaceae bacterium]
MKEFVTWMDVESYVHAVAEFYKGKGITGVYGLPRGGVVFAVMLSHLMGVPMLGAPCKGCLVVDDIADSGETLLHYERKGYHITTMFYHKGSSVVPEFWIKEKKDCWIVYPWEMSVCTQ